MEIVPGCAVTVSYLPSPFIALVPPENSLIGSMVVPGCLERLESSFFPGGLGEEGTAPHSVVGPPATPRVHVHMRMGKAQLSGHILESGAGHCLPVCGGPGVVRRQVPWLDSAVPWRCHYCRSSIVVDIPVVVVQTVLVELPQLQLSTVVDIPTVAQRQDLGSNCMKTVSLHGWSFSAVFRRAHHTTDELNSSQ